MSIRSELYPQTGQAEQPVLFEGPETAADHPPYELLVGHERTDGSYKSSAELRTEYVQLTDDIIYQITEGVPDGRDPVTGELITVKPDFVVWLDKSARPVAWLTKELWPVLAPSLETGETPEMPEFRFVNIDREQWVNTVDPNGSGYMNIDLVDDSVIRSLRSIFVKPEHKGDGLTEDVDSAPAELDGKTILIIDEVRSSGKTLDIASKFFTRAFPTARVATSYWMKGMTTVGSRKGGTAEANADLPVWYKENDETGRGVGNRDERVSQRSDSLTQRLGGWFLSTRLSLPRGEVVDTNDPTSNQLRHEVQWLAADVRDHKVLVVPSLQRDDFEVRASVLNGGIDLETFKEEKAALSNS